MTKRRFRRGNFSIVDIPAPVSLMKTSETGIDMSIKYAVDIENLLPTKKRRLSKRSGLTDISLTGITTGEKIVAGTSLGLSDGTFKLVVATDAGKIYTSNTGLTAWTATKTGLTTTGTYRFAYFDSKLVIVNGIDNNMYYDGTSIVDISEFVDDSLAGVFTKVDADTFTFTDGASRGTTDYPAGRKVRLYMDSSATYVSAVVLSSTGTTGGTITVNLTTSAITGTVIDAVWYEDKPPPFSFIYAAHNRLYALSGGELKARTYRNLDTSSNLTVFYTDSTNNVNGWFNQTTQEVAFINMENKHVENDEFVGISLFQSKLVFFGRNNTQVWSGTNPTGGSDPLVWTRTFNVGCINGNLIQEVDNDILFYTQGEIRSFSIVTVTNDLESSQEKGSNIAERVSNQVKKLISTDTLYKTARSFLYPAGGFVGFKLPEEVHIRIEEQDFDGWVRFTQLFKQCTDYSVAPNGKMYMFFEETTYVYDDLNNVGSDNLVAIRTSWTTPFIQPKKGRIFAGKYYQLITESGDTMQVSVTRYKDNSTCNSKKTTVITNPAKSGYWDEMFWDVDFWDCADDAVIPTQEDKFMSETIAYNITTENTLADVHFVGLRIYGRGER